MTCESQLQPLYKALFRPLLNIFILLKQHLTEKSEVVYRRVRTRVVVKDGKKPDRWPTSFKLLTYCSGLKRFILWMKARSVCSVKITAICLFTKRDILQLNRCSITGPKNQKHPIYIIKHARIEWDSFHKKSLSEWEHFYITLV